MLRLAAMLYPIVGTVLAGVGVAVALAAPSLGFATLEGIGLVAGIGFALGAPVSVLIAWPISRSGVRI